MAGTVETDIKVNVIVKSDTTELNRLQSEMQEIGNIYNSVQERINESNNNIKGVTKETLDSIANDINAMQNKVLSIADNLSDNQFENAYTTVEKLKTEFNELKNILDATGISSVNTRKDIGSSGGMMKELLKNSSFTNISQEEQEKIAKENEEREKLVETINREYEAKRKLEEASRIQADLEKAWMGNFDLNGGVTPSEEMIQGLDILQDKSNDVEKTAVNIDKVKEALGGLIESGKLSKNSINELLNALGLSAKEISVFTIAVSALIAELKLFKKAYDNTVESIKNIGEGAFDLIGSSTEFVIDSFEELISVADEVISKLQEFADQGKEIQDAYFSLYSFLGEELGDEVSNFANELEKVYGLDATGVVADMNKLVVSASKMGDMSNDIAQVSEAMYMFSKNLSVVANTDLSRVINDLSTAINTGNVGRQSSLYSIFSKEEVNELKQLNTEAERWNYIRNKGLSIEGAYEKYLATDAGKLEQLNQQWNSFLGNIGQLALGLYAKLAPLLTTLLQLANKVVTTLMSIFDINVTDATGDGIAGLIDNTADSYDELSKSAEKANRQIMDFDDVNPLNKSSSNNIPGISNTEYTNLINNADLLNNKVEETKSKLEELLLNKDYRGLGGYVGDLIKDWLTDIPWSDFQNNLYNTGDAISEFINGIVNTDNLGDVLGNNLAEIINTGIIWLESLGENLDFTSIGEFLSDAWNEFWNGLKTDDLANTVMTWFIGLFETINGFLSDKPFENAGSTLADLINAFFFGGTNSVTGEETLGLTSERMDEIVNGIIGFIDGIFNGIDTFLDKTNIEGIKEKLKQLIIKIGEAFSENSGDWGSTLNELISTLFTTASELLSTANTSGIRDGITKFIWNLDLGELISQYTHLQLQLWWFNFVTDVTAKGSSFIQFIGEFFVKVSQLMTSLSTLLGVGILKGIEWLLQQVFKASDSFRTWLEGLGTTIGNGVGTFIGNIISIVINGIVNISTSVRNGLNNIWENISNIFENIWNTVTGWITDIRDAIAGMFDGFSDLELNINTPFGSVGIDPSQWEIPFATGGIVNRATHALIGEAGREAVLPLENNTGWMDELASALVSKMNTNNNTGNNSITIDMSGYSKNFYTRAEMLEFGKQVVDALKLYGVNVAAIY